jgi:hypothetical protein
MFFIRFLKSYIVTYLIYLFSATLIWIIVHGIDFWVDFIVYQIAYGSIIILVASIMIELLLFNSKDYTIKNNWFTIFLGFIYGLLMSLVFGSGFDKDIIYMNLLIGLYFSVIFYIYLSLKKLIK